MSCVTLDLCENSPSRHVIPIGIMLLMSQGVHRINLLVIKNYGREA